MKERIIRAAAGVLVILSILLALWINIYWLGLAVFVALNLFQSSLSGFCPLEYLLKRIEDK